MNFCLHVGFKYSKFWNESFVSYKQLQEKICLIFLCPV